MKIGQRHFMLVAISPEEKRKGHWYWKVRCDCGVEKLMADTAFYVSGTTKSCGCLTKKITAQRATKGFPGARFGLLTLIERSGTSKHGNLIWKCQCDCGGTKDLPYSSLSSGNTKSCGCLSPRIPGPYHCDVTAEERAIRAHRSARARLKKINRVPIWSQRKEILNFYLESARKTRDSGEQHHVDHIIPIQGDLCSGLHVAENLAVLPAGLNRSKKNRFQPYCVT